MKPIPEKPVCGASPSPHTEEMVNTRGVIRISSIIPRSTGVSFSSSHWEKRRGQLQPFFRSCCRNLPWSLTPYALPRRSSTSLLLPFYFLLSYFKILRKFPAPLRKTRSFTVRVPLLDRYGHCRLTPQEQKFHKT